MLMMIGIYHAMMGLVAIIDKEFYVATENYLFEFNVTAWGWIHLILGIVVVVAGVGIFRGTMLGRTIGVIVAGLSGLAAFAWIPYYPLWGIVLVALSVAAIWALTAHGTDLAEETRSTF
jgi:hypothetical protein